MRRHVVSPVARARRALEKDLECNPPALTDHEGTDR